MQPSQAKDSNTQLPRAVLRRTAAIEARIAAQNESKTDPVDPNAIPPTGAAPSPPPLPPTPPAEPPAPATDPRENDPAYWRQRFNVTAGVLKAERNERRAEADEVDRKMTELKEQVRSLQATSSPAATKLDVGQFFTPEQIEQFGEDQCAAMARAAMKSAQTAVQEAIDAEVKPMREKQERDEKQTAADKKTQFTDRLAELVPDYAEIDNGDDWKAWLAQEDEGTGLERQEVLNRHIQTLNASKVAKMFNDFSASKAPKPPPVVARGNGANPPGPPLPSPDAVALKPPSDAEVKDYFKRAALGRVKAEERVEFEARMKLRTAAR